MYVIRNLLNGQYASGDWFVGGNTRPWCGLEAARVYSCPDLARREMLINAYPGTTQVVDFPRVSFLKRCFAAVRRFALIKVPTHSENSAS
jgi:hypothetical protein